MVKSNTSHENAIKCYRKLANMMVIKNIQLFYATSARMMLFDFKKRSYAMGDLQRDIRPGNACSGLLLLAYTHRNRLESSKGLELASKYEFDSPLFPCFF